MRLKLAGAMFVISFVTTSSVSPSIQPPRQWPEQLLIMNKDNSKYIDIFAAKQVYDEGGNVTEHLRQNSDVGENSVDIIELAYDLQAGTYVDFARRNSEYISAYTSEVSSLLEKHLRPTDSLLDVGTGELTTISHVVNRIRNKPARVLAFDISWSRIYRGLPYARDVLGDGYERFTAFVGDMSQVPLMDKSVNVTTSYHALEPNGGRLKELLRELFRVTSNKLVLFEPCYEINTDEGKRRMERLGYIRDIEGAVKDLGGEMIEKVRLESNVNPLNPTVCFVIKPPALEKSSVVADRDQSDIFSVPGMNSPLNRVDNFYYSSAVGLAFPVLKSIPILRSGNAIIASALAFIDQD